MNVWLSLLLVGCISIPTWAQRKKADRLYAARGYHAYLELYENAKLEELDRQTLERLGESSRKVGDQREAERIYGALVQLDNPDPYWYLYYAQALQFNGNCLQAKEQFKKADQLLKAQASNKKDYDQRAKLGYETCEQLAALRAIGPVTVRAEQALNSSSFDFSPMYYGEGLVWVSTRNKSERRDRWLGDNYMDLYYAEQKEDSVYSKPQLFAEQLLTELHEGPCVFTNDQKRIYFTRNNLFEGKKGKSADGTTKLNLYTAELVEGKWINEAELPFNNPEIDQVHPALTANQRMLVFASNAKGGFGGMDLWASRLNDKGEWTKPINLGSRINTPGDEVFPFIHEDGTLYFASSGWSTLGGLDIFMATQVYNHPDSLWEYPFNIGSPINTSNDDFGLIIDKNKTAGYYSSSQGTEDTDNIYHFKIGAGLDEVAPLPTLSIDVCVYDDDTRLRLNDAQLTVVHDSELSPDTNTYTTSTYGYTVCQFRAGDAYFIDVKREGYASLSDYFIMPRDVRGIQEYCIGLTRDLDAPLEIDTTERQLYATSEIPPVNYVYNPNIPLPPLHVKGRVINTAENRPLANSSVILLNRCTGEQLVMQVNDDGVFAFPLECGCDYVVKSKKNRFYEDDQVISLEEGDCDAPVLFDLALTPVDAEQPLAIGKLKKGDVIKLENIFYDYDKWNIRTDAVQELNELVALMKQYPDMEIELSAHTDRRGSSAYNQVLSDKRARSARGYLIDRGIAAERITTIGYGEERLVNNCQVCSEADHQENRRTEVLITKFEKME